MLALILGIQKHLTLGENTTLCRLLKVDNFLVFHPNFRVLFHSHRRPPYYENKKSSAKSGKYFQTVAELIA